MNGAKRAIDLESKLKAHGYRLTPQRVAIIQALVDTQDHPSVEQIYGQVKTEFPMTSLATVYKTIAMLKALDEVQEINLNAGGSRYDGNKPYSHPHLICIRCQKIIDAEVANLEALTQQLVQQTGYQIIDQRLDFFGICPQCAAGQ